MSAPVREAILDSVHRRGEGKTLCPSEIAKALAPEDWRSLMPLVRQQGALLLTEGQIAVTQKGRAVDPLEAKGPIRLGLPNR